MEYYFNELDPITFQRLINAILIERYGEGIRLMPARGQDGGQDAVIDPEDSYFFELQLDSLPTKYIGETPPAKGRYVFQVKMHRTNDITANELTKRIFSDFSKELRKNVLNRSDEEKINFFYLITNIPQSNTRRKKLEDTKKNLLKDIADFHADIWWQEWITAYLDLLPNLAHAYPQLFAGRKTPFETEFAKRKKEELPVAVQMLIKDQYTKDSKIKFKQIELSNSLNKLFIDTETHIKHLTPEEQKCLYAAEVARQKNLQQYKVKHRTSALFSRLQDPDLPISTLGVLLDEAPDSVLDKIILEGGPGQGKSTITQMLAQIHRHPKIEQKPLDPEGRWIPPKKLRLPFRIELQQFANKLGRDWKSVEEYLVSIIRDAAGGREFNVTDLQDVFRDFPILLIFDGLDEVGNEQHIENVLIKITECISRCKDSFQSNLRVIITTRPPAIIGHREHLAGFTRLPIAPMSPMTVEQYLERWLNYQINDQGEKDRVQKAFKKRQNEPHVRGLVRNPMQLSIVLYLIEIKEEAFPDRRTDLYAEYFQKVIEREITKSPELHIHQEIIKALHEFLGYKIHALTETKYADGTLGYHQLLKIVEEWLKDQKDGTKATDLFTLGRDRLGLIVALKGEGENAYFGYEIQPVREYFAAAFINNQIVGDSHDAFEEMAQRPYWREVALFLAGMVKPKEKADLISRARSIDREEASGWRQDGRGIILQLLQEGVFSQPSRVFIDGLDFVFEVLDPRRVNRQKTIDNLSETLASLILQTVDKDKYINGIYEMLKYYENSNDGRIIYRLYNLLHKLIKPEKMRKALMSYNGKSADIITLIRVEWPCSWGISMENEAQDPTFWEGVPDFKWAERLWLTYLLSHKNKFSVVNLPIPEHLHQNLIEIWALNPIPKRYFFFPRSSSFYHSLLVSSSNWAIWNFAAYQRIITSLIMDNKKFTFKPNFLEKNVNTNTSGLIPEIQEPVFELLKVLKDALMFAVDGFSDKLVACFPTLQKYLIKPGLLSLIACQCTVSILQCFFISNTDDFSLPEEWWAMFRNLKMFYTQLQSKYASFNEFTDNEEVKEVILELSAPDCIRLNTDGEFANIASLIVDIVCYNKYSYFSWLRDIPMSVDTIITLFNDHKNNEYDLIRAVSEINIVMYDKDKCLSNSQVKAIITIADATDDPQILFGSFNALSTSKFLELAGTKLVLKLLRSRANNIQSLPPSLIFTKLYTPFKSIEEETDENIVIDIAQEILACPHIYDFCVICDAATYLTEHTSRNLAPILSMEEELKLYISRN